MIILTRLNGGEITINAEQIEMLESTPETVVTLTNGKRLTVKEAPGEIVERVIRYKREIVLPVVK